MEKNNFCFQNLKTRIKNRMENYFTKWNKMTSEGFKDIQFEVDKVKFAIGQRNFGGV